MTKIIILASGIADLTTAIAALTADDALSPAQPSGVVAVVIGHRVSLPENLVDAFQETAVKAFDVSRIEAFRWGENDAAIDNFAEVEGDAEIVAANQLQDPQQRRLIAALRPKNFIFYDNGLSSYASHNVDIETWAFAMPKCRRFAAYLSHAGEFGVPSYLSSFTTSKLAPEALKKSAEHVRKACVSTPHLLPPEAVVILGTSFDRTNIISADEERMLHKQMINAIRKRHKGPFFFKPHPRASKAYLTEEDGVATLSTELPVEAYVSHPKGTAYSFSSTALFSLPAMFGWCAHRVAHPFMEKVFKARPQLAKIRVMDPSLVLEIS